MFRFFSKTSTLAIVISALFLLTPFGTALLVSPAAASTSATASATRAPTLLNALQSTWTYPNGNALGQDYSLQNMINSSNAQYLGLAWNLPLPVPPIGLASVPGGLGVDMAPLIVNGTVYATTQFGEVFAINMTSGQSLWDYVIPLNVNSVKGQGTTGLDLHLNDGAEQFTTATIGPMVSGPTYWVDGPNHVVYAINANDGHLELNFSQYGSCLASTLSNPQPTPVSEGGVPCGVTEIAGNAPGAVYSGLATNFLIDQSKGILIGSMVTSSSDNAARCFYHAWNIAVYPPSLMWTTFCSPPQQGSNTPLNPNWDMAQVNGMGAAAIFYPGPSYNGGGPIASSAVVNLKSLTSTELNSTLYNDWGYSFQSVSCTSEDGGYSPGSTGAGSGGQWLLGTGPTGGMAFVATGNKGPYNGDCTPGPDLWASSVLALNETTGAWAWGFQASAHDQWGGDCSYWQALANETVSGTPTQVLFKTCKNGYLYELNAQTGAMIWAWTPTTSILARCHYCYILDPLNATQMDEFFFNPGLTTTLMFPSANSPDMDEASYNPQLNMIYMATSNVPMDVKYVQLTATNYGTSNGQTNLALPSTAPDQDNSTIEGINATTGAQVWQHFVPNEGYEGGITSSGGVVFLTFSSGDVLTLNAASGNKIQDLLIGGPLNDIPTIGATTSGTEEVVLSSTEGMVTWGTSAVSGGIVALNLNIPAGATLTSTATSTTTTTSTTTVRTASTVTVGGSTVTVGAGQITTITVSGTTTTIRGPTTTVAVATSTATVTSTTTSVATGTSATGFSPTILYGVAALAVIFIVAAGYLALRSRKPASS